MLPLFALSLLAGLLTATLATAGSDGLDVAIGKATFDRFWVQAPASTKSADGLGPLFAARSCASCHAGSGGRTTFRLGRDDPKTSPGLVIRIADAEGRPDPIYGRQLQPQGTGDISGEGIVSGHLAPAEKSGRPSPEWSVERWFYGQPSVDSKLAPRVAPSLAGLGALERVPEEALVALETKQAGAKDGVSGRVARLTSGEIGRFGWKAAEPTLRSQAASAFLLDLGLSTTDHPQPAGECTAAQTACLEAPQGASAGQPEVEPALMAGLMAYLDRRPAPPAPERDARGEKLFAATGCATCHAPSLPVSGGGQARAFTDLLLHDMGEGLDDGAGEGAAKSAEWRTAPLWGLSASLAKGSGLLHDGRAADVAEAVGWHGGEAQAARRRFERLSKRDREALVAYVAGL